jgi:hypothetical protein
MTMPDQPPETIAELWLELRQDRDRLDALEMEIAKLATEGCDAHARSLEDHDVRLTEAEKQLRDVRRELSELRTDVRGIVRDVGRVADWTTTQDGRWSILDLRLRAIVDHFAPVAPQASKTETKRSPFDE